MGERNLEREKELERVTELRISKKESEIGGLLDSFSMTSYYLNIGK